MLGFSTSVLPLSIEPPASSTGPPVSSQAGMLWWQKNSCGVAAGVMDRFCSWNRLSSRSQAHSCSGLHIAQLPKEPLEPLPRLVALGFDVPKRHPILVPPGLDSRDDSLAVLSHVSAQFSAQLGLEDAKHECR